jgi:hypothetical protein
MRDLGGEIVVWVEFRLSTEEKAKRKPGLY